MEPNEGGNEPPMQPNPPNPPQNPLQPPYDYQVMQVWQSFVSDALPRWYSWHTIFEFVAIDDIVMNLDLPWCFSTHPTLLDIIVLSHAYSHIADLLALQSVHLVTQG